MTWTDQFRARLSSSAGAARNRFQVTLGAQRVDILSDHADAARILEHVFDAQAHVAASTEPPQTQAAWTICTLAVDDYPDLLNRLAQQADGASQNGGLADYWRPDFVAQPLERAPARALIRHAEPFEGLTVFDRDDRRIVYLHPAGAPLFAPHLEHLIGYAVRSGCWEHSFVELHAAFIRYRGKGAALIGKRQAGKTSLAMHFLSRGAQLLGSDMAEIHFAEGAVVAQAIPHMCRITPETVRDNAALAAALGSACDVNTDYLAGPLFSHGKYELYAPSLDAVFGRKVSIAQMTVDALLFPHFCLDAAQQNIRPVDKREGVRRLLDSVDHDPPLADWLPFDVSFRKQTSVAARNSLDWDEMSIQCFDLDFGKEGSLSWPDIDQLFDRL